MRHPNSQIVFDVVRSGDVNGFYPPLGNYELTVTPPLAGLPLGFENGALRLHVDQIAGAKTVAGAKAPSGGTFLMLGFTLSDTGQMSIAVGPENLHLITPTGDLLSSQTLDPRTAIEKFHTITIQPGHGTAVLDIFSIPAPGQFDRLVYSDPQGNRLELSLKP